MEFKSIHLIYIIIILCVYCNLFTTRNMSDRFNKGIIIKNDKLKKLLFMRKNEYISYVSIVFLVIDYINLLITIACFVICLFTSDIVAKYISWILFGFTGLIFLIEMFFLPPYGVRGS